MYFNLFLESRHRQFEIIAPQYNTNFPFNVGLYSYHLQYLIILHNLMSSESHYGHTKCLFQKQRQHCDTLEMTPSAHYMHNINFLTSYLSSQIVAWCEGQRELTLQLLQIFIIETMPLNFVKYMLRRKYEIILFQYHRSQLTTLQILYYTII